MRVHVRTPSRLHFALIDLNGQLGRVDGSLGLAIDKPNVILEARPSSTVEIVGERSSFVKELALEFMRHYKITKGISIRVRSMIPGHVGLGSSTQTSLAVASSLARVFGLNEPVRKLAQVMGRGGTSGIGVAAFEKGGFILDAGHSFGEGKEKQSFLPSRASRARPAPLLARYDFPKNWIFVIAVPNVPLGAHGEKETEIFRERCPIPSDQVAEVCRVIVMKILPALVEKDIAEFGKGLNRLQEIGFAATTRDLINPFVKECMNFMMERGAYGAGQSSFGPTTFGLVHGEKQAHKLRKEIQKFIDQNVGGRVFCSQANNSGASIRFIRAAR